MMTTLGARISADDLTKQSEGLKQLKGVHLMEEAAVDWGLWEDLRWMCKQGQVLLWHRYMQIMKKEDISTYFLSPHFDHLQ